MSKNSLGTKKNLTVAGKEYEIFDISSVEGATNLPFSLKVLLENLLRTEDGANITADHIKALAQWDPAVEPDTEIQFTPARVVMQDFTGVPCIVDLATMREAIVDLGETHPRSIHLHQLSSLLITLLSQMSSERRIHLSRTQILNMNVTASVIASFVGGRALLMNSRLFHLEQESFTK